MDRRLMGIGALVLGIGVALGAFGAHALKALLTPASLEIYHTGVLYQLVHGLAILAMALGASTEPKLKASGWLFLIGTVIFSGSLYVLALSGIKVLGAITPLGGLAYLIGWGIASWNLLKKKPA